MQAVRDPASRQSTIALLRPTFPPSSTARPTIEISSEAASLPFPPPSKASSTSGVAETIKDKEKDKERERAASGKFGRINPFASFFGQASTPSGTGSATPSSPSRGVSSPERPTSPVHPASPSSFAAAIPQLSPRPSLLSMQMSDTASIRSQDQTEGFHVTAHTVNRPIRSAEVQKSLPKAIRACIREECAGLPDKVIEKIAKLVISGACPTTSSAEILKSQHSSESDPSLIIDFSAPTEVGNKLQDFVEGVYDDVMAHCRSEEGKSFTLRRRTSGNVSRKKQDGSDGRTEKMSREEAIEKEASEAAERVESLICRFLYNR